MTRLLPILAVLMLCGCLGPRATPAPKPTPPPPQMPLTKAGAVGEVTRIATPTGITVTLAWNNYPDFGPAGNAQLRSGLQASTNLIDWVDAGRWPYATQMRVTLTNRPFAPETYRAFNCYKP